MTVDNRQGRHIFLVSLIERSRVMVLWPISARRHSFIHTICPASFLFRCPVYPKLPSYCKSVNVPGQCCPSLTCDIPGYGTYNPVPQLVPTPRPSAPPGGTTSNPLIIIPQPQQPCKYSSKTFHMSSRDGRILHATSVTCLTQFNLWEPVEQIEPVDCIETCSETG